MSETNIDKVTKKKPPSTCSSKIKRNKTRKKHVSLNFRADFRKGFANRVPGGVHVLLGGLRITDLFLLLKITPFSLKRARTLVSQIRFSVHFIFKSLLNDYPTLGLTFKSKFLKN